MKTEIPGATLHITEEIPSANRELVDQQIMFREPTGLHHFGLVKEALTDDLFRVETSYYIKRSQIVEVKGHFIGHVSSADPTTVTQPQQQPNQEPSLLSPIR